MAETQPLADDPDSSPRMWGDVANFLSAYRVSRWDWAGPFELTDEVFAIAKPLALESAKCGIASLTTLVVARHATRLRGVG